MYDERLAVGWRALVDQPVSFPFGHGLSYTRFLYTWLATPQRHAASGEVRLGLLPEPLTRTLDPNPNPNPNPNPDPDPNSDHNPNPNPDPEPAQP